MRDVFSIIGSLRDFLRLSAREKQEFRDVLRTIVSSDLPPDLEATLRALRSVRLTPTESASVRAILAAEVRGSSRLPLEDLLASLATLKLSEQERDEHRDLLRALSDDPRAPRHLSVADLHLRSEEKSVIRADLIRNIEARRMSLRPGLSVRRFVVVRSLATVLAAVVLLFASGGAIVSAAESTIPGDFLYGLKTGVTERVLAAFQSKDAWAMQKVERRLREAQVAAARPSLTDEQESSVIYAIDAALADAEKTSSTPENLRRLRQIRHDEFDDDDSLPSEKTTVLRHLRDIRRIQSRGILSTMSSSDEGAESSATTESFPKRVDRLPVVPSILRSAREHDRASASSAESLPGVLPALVPFGITRDRRAGPENLVPKNEREHGQTRSKESQQREKQKRSASSESIDDHPGKNRDEGPLPLPGLLDAKQPPDDGGEVLNPNLRQLP